MPGYPPSHRDTRDPQPEVCDICGLKVGGSRLRRSRTPGIEGRMVCDVIHDWRDNLTRRDIERQHPGLPGPKFIGSSRVYEPGDEEWWIVDPISAIKAELSAGDVLLTADSLSIGALNTTWTDEKSGLVFAIGLGAKPTAAVDSTINNRKSVTLVSDNEWISSGASFNPASGITAIAVVKPTPADAIASLIAQKNGTGTGRSWLRTNDFYWGSHLGGAITAAGLATSDWQIVSVRVDADEVITVRAGIEKLGASVGGATGEMVVGANKSGGNQMTGTLAAVVLAASDLGAQVTRSIEALLSTYYSLVRANADG